MTRVNYRKKWSGKGELTTRDVGCETSTIDRLCFDIIELKGVCGCLLHIEKQIVKLFHPCSQRKGYGNELGCPDCLAINEAMVRDSNDYRQCISNGNWCELSYSKM